MGRRPLGDGGRKGWGDCLPPVLLWCPQGAGCLVTPVLSAGPLPSSPICLQAEEAQGSPGLLCGGCTGVLGGPPRHRRWALPLEELQGKGWVWNTYSHCRGHSAPGSPPCSGHVRSRPHLRPGCCALEGRPPHPQGARGGGDGGNTKGEALTATPEPWIQACGSHHVTWSRGLGNLSQTWPPW